MTTLRERLRKVVASQAEIEADEERVEAEHFVGCTPVGTVKDRTRATVSGVVRSMTLATARGRARARGRAVRRQRNARPGLARSSGDRRDRPRPPAADRGHGVRGRRSADRVQPRVRAAPAPGRVSERRRRRRRDVTPDPDLAHRHGRADGATVGARGMRALTQEEFSALDALGGVRGVVESVVPGLLFVVVYLAAGQRLAPALIASAGAAVLAVLVRLVQRTPPTQAFSGVLGVGIGVLWAWRTGEAEDYFLYGLLVNAALPGGHPGLGPRGLAARRPRHGAVRQGGLLAGGSWSAAVAWRQDRSLRRRYACDLAVGRAVRAPAARPGPVLPRR